MLGQFLAGLRKRLVDEFLRNALFPEADGDLHVSPKFIHSAASRPLAGEEAIVKILEFAKPCDNLPDNFFPKALLFQPRPQFLYAPSPVEEESKGPLQGFFV